MPKIIKNLQKEILYKSRLFLKEHGFENFTVRAVANECNIAVGTIYNYYPSKESLIANIMLDGWKEQIEMIKSKTERSFNCTYSLKIIFGYLYEYQKNYKSTWANLVNSADIENEHRAILFEELSELIHSTFLYFGVNMSPDPTAFVTEILLFETTKENIEYDDIAPFIERIIKL
ncbi:MAG: TetR/AcrR family transcriptional regulator [Clostridia bacterium]|nr:TetR/AcrR family transcriptional regulator [Clostridia bacterium]